MPTQRISAEYCAAVQGKNRGILLSETKWVRSQGFCLTFEYKLARRDLNPDLENQNLSCYQLHHGLRIETQEKAFQHAGILLLSMAVINGVFAQIFSARESFLLVGCSLFALGSCWLTCSGRCTAVGRKTRIGLVDDVAAATLEFPLSL